LGAGSTSELILRGDVAARLYAHQREGVAWLHSLLVAGGQRAAAGGAAAGRPLSTWGGLLADDMGLGKTMQVAAFLAGSIDSGLARRALVVAPKTLLAQWAAELAGVGLGGLVFEYLSPNPAERAAALASVAAPGSGRGILLTTYGMVLHNSTALAGAFGRVPGGGLASEDDDGAWDVLVCDEGHKLKNAATQLMGKISTIPVRTRVVLSGTPVQNDLNELFTLMDWAAPGLLGDAKAFKADFAKPITAGADRGASDRERAAGAGAAAELRARLAPCFLRRDKASVFGSTASSSTTRTRRMGRRRPAVRPRPRPPRWAPRPTWWSGCASPTRSAKFTRPSFSPPPCARP
jgi:SNF2 family DNA or RNA helicase